MEDGTAIVLSYFATDLIKVFCRFSAEMWTLTISERITSNSANFGTFVREQLHLITHAKTGELIAMLVCREKRLGVATAPLYRRRKTRYCHSADIPDRYARIEGARHTRNLASLRPAAADHFASRCAARQSAFNGPFSVQTFAVSIRHIYNVKVCTLPLSELD